MSKSFIKEKQKRKKLEIKKTKQKKKLLLISICVLITLVALIFILHSVVRKNENEIMETYSYHGQTVQLLTDGKFSASLAHGVKKNGTYKKTTENDIIIVSFNVNGKEEIGRIINNSLHIPGEWDDGHGHGNVFPKIK
jgi:predicted AlkP superfamily pyrophosphatase or phosphodiesterase